jgi:DNA replication protein DnaC
MIVPETLLSKYVEVKGRFRRSAHLEKDFTAASQNGDYFLTPAARDALRRLAEGMSNGSPYRAWTLTGPYGVGKSAFAVFLTRLLCNGGTSRQRV